ncbi:MAG: hypothetical protein LBT68_05230 [Spirochaetales bacterium]|jgi:hypothetical protein|nr:hypothetical protein [Spirochaetales bacterium]
MGKKISVFYGIFSIAFFAALALLFYSRIEEIKKNNTQAISAGFDQVRRIVETTYINQESFDSMYFKDMVNKIFSLDKNLDLLVVYSYDTGIEYLRARDSRYLPGTAQDIAAVRGVPRFSYNHFSRTQIASSITVPKKSSFIIEGVYRILQDRELFTVLRDTVVILIIFAIITAALILLLRLLDEGKAAPLPAAPPPPVRPRRALPPPAPEVRRVILMPPVTPTPVRESEPPVTPAPVRETAPPAPATPPKPAATHSEPPPENLPPAAADTPPEPEQSPEKTSASETFFTSAIAGNDWRARLEKRMSLELERAAYNEQDLTLIILKFPGLKQTSHAYSALAREIQQQLSFEDLTFGYPPDGYAVILPNSNLDQSIGTLRNFLKTIDAEPLCGLSSRNGRLVDGSRLLLEGEEALKRTRAGGNDSIIGFRPDPGKYRSYIAGQETSVS